MNICFKRVDNENIIYIKCDNNIDDKIDEDAEVGINGNETDVFYIIDKGIISYSRRLLQIIKCFIQFANLEWVVNEVIKLFHINLFLNLIVKKSDFDVHLLQISIFDDDQYKDRLI